MVPEVLQEGITGVTASVPVSEEEEEESEEAFSACCVAMRRGRFLRCSRMRSVSPPSPMDVKKLMLKRMLRSVSCAQTQS